MSVVSCTGLSPSLVGLSSTVPLSQFTLVTVGPTTPVDAEAQLVWAAPLSLATTHGIISFPPGT